MAVFPGTCNNPLSASIRMDPGRPAVRTSDARFRGTFSDGEVYVERVYFKSKWPQDILTRQTESSTLVEQQVIEDMGE